MARALAPHGTVAAYKRHRRAGEAACPDCLRAKREHEHERRRAAAAEAARRAALEVQVPEDAPEQVVEFDAVDLAAPEDGEGAPVTMTPEGLAAVRDSIRRAAGQRDRPMGPDVAEDLNALEDGEDGPAEDDAYTMPLGMTDAVAIAALPRMAEALEAPDQEQELLALRAVLWQSLRIAAVTEPTRVAGITRELRAVLADIKALNAGEETEEDPFDAITDDDGFNVYSIASAPPGASTG